MAQIMLTSEERPHRSYVRQNAVSLRNQQVYGRNNRSALFADTITSARKHMQGFCFSFIISAFNTIISKHLQTIFSQLLHL